MGSSSDRHSRIWTTLHCKCHMFCVVCITTSMNALAPSLNFDTCFTRSSVLDSSNNVLRIAQALHVISQNANRACSRDISHSLRPPSQPHQRQHLLLARRRCPKDRPLSRAMERPLDMAKLFGEPAFADVAVKFSGRELKLHKVILCTRSKYFEKAFATDGHFAVRHT